MSERRYILKVNGLVVFNIVTQRERYWFTENVRYLVFDESLYIYEGVCSAESAYEAKRQVPEAQYFEE